MTRAEMNKRAWFQIRVDFVTIYIAKTNHNDNNIGYFDLQFTDVLKAFKSKLRL